MVSKAASTMHHGEALLNDWNPSLVRPATAPRPWPCGILGGGTTGYCGRAQPRCQGGTRCPPRGGACIGSALAATRPGHHDGPTGRRAGPRHAASLPPAHVCTLYSGGATGADTVRRDRPTTWHCWVNFTFDGHNQARSEGAVVLDEQELAAGDVSLVYVAHRLHRHWDKTETLRKVLQTQWHVVSHMSRVFVVGNIQPDGTVHGGTGWSVELARRWNKRVWVFDQTHGTWFTWSGSAWTRASRSSRPQTSLARARDSSMRPGAPRSSTFSSAVSPTAGGRRLAPNRAPDTPGLLRDRYCRRASSVRNLVLR